MRITRQSMGIMYLLPLLALSSSVAGATQYVSNILYFLSEPSGIAGIDSGETWFSPKDTSQEITAGAAVGSGHVSGGNVSNALYWSPSGSVTNLNPSQLGFVSSGAVDTDGQYEVGSGSFTPGPTVTHALLWSGTASSAVDLNPAGYTASFGYGVGGGQEVGYGDGTNQHALLWTGTAASFVDLHPTNLPSITTSVAFATDGAHQVGAGNYYGGGTGHALLWSDTAASAIDLNPNNLPGVSSSVALGVGGGEEVGYGAGASLHHAMVWSGTAASAVDLNPTDFSGIVYSEAFAANGYAQVGWGDDEQGGPYEALLWFGSADSAINLQSLLPGGGSSTNSVAYSIDASGNVFGIAHGTINNESGYFAVEWSPVPEPGTIALVTAFMFALRRTRKR